MIRRTNEVMFSTKCYIKSIKKTVSKFGGHLNLDIQDSHKMQYHLCWFSTGVVQVQVRCVFPPILV